jgi:hypothetical protein
MVPTKADPLHERMLHAFGEKRIQRSFENMVSCHGNNLINCLTDEARKELLLRCIVSHKLSRKFAAESRKLYREQQKAVA